MSIIREHGGNIEAEILPAGGSAFTICLPVASAESPETVSAPKESGAMSSDEVRPAADLLRGRAVLVLDDEESLRMLLQEGLSAHGLRVGSAATADEALALLERSSYDVFLCDLHLSSGGFFVNGREAAGRILEAAGAQKPALIFMTGDLVEGSQEAEGQSEPVCLQKPFRVSDVLSLLREVLSGAPAETRQTR